MITLEDLSDIIKHESRDRFRLKFNDFIYEHPQYSNLSQDNRKLITDLLYKHIDAIRENRGISSYLIEKETHRLYEKRNELKITENDLEDIREMLKLFKK
jgi:hypothetical protein